MAASVRRRFLRAVAACALLPFAARAEAPRSGIVLMHGKSGAPTSRQIGGLAAALADKGLRVANLEMPWSGRRDYDATTAEADRQIDAALADLRAQGAQRLFVAGHSMGGVFALHYGATHELDGVICIAPGGSVAAPGYAERIAGALAEARRLVAEGKGQESARLMDYEGSKGSYPLVTTPAHYLDWFDPAGAMNLEQSARTVKVPVLWLVAQRDYPALRKSNPRLFQLFPPNPLHRMVEPDTDHHGAPGASVDLIVDWIGAVVAARP